MTDRDTSPDPFENWLRQQDPAALESSSDGPDSVAPEVAAYWIAIGRQREIAEPSSGSDLPDGRRSRESPDQLQSVSLSEHWKTLVSHAITASVSAVLVLALTLPLAISNSPSASPKPVPGPSLAGSETEPDLPVDPSMKEDQIAADRVTPDNYLADDRITEAPFPSAAVAASAGSRNSDRTRRPLTASNNSVVELLDNAIDEMFDQRRDATRGLSGYSFRRQKPIRSSAIPSGHTVGELSKQLWGRPDE